MTYGGPPPNPHDPFGSSPYGHNPFGSPPIVTAPLPPGAHTNTYATLSVIFAFVFAPAGAVLGHLGLTQIHRSGQRGRNRALIGLILSYTFITIAVAALVIAAVNPDTPSAPATSANPPTSAPTTTATQPGPVTKAQLAGLLPSVDEVQRVANAPNTYTTKDTPNLAGSAGMTISPPECLPAMYGGSDQVYLNSGASATQARIFNTTGESGLTLLEERVLLFQNPTVAQEQLDKVVDMWRGCAGTTVTMVIEGKPRPSYILMGQVSSPGDSTVFTLRNTVRGAPANLTNERAIVAKANVIVDITMQGLDLGDSITAVTADILDRIPA